jgi:hypothetical protein
VCEKVELRGISTAQERWTKKLNLCGEGIRVYNYRQWVRVVKPENVRLMGHSTWMEMLRKYFKIIFEKLRKNT